MTTKPRKPRRKLGVARMEGKTYLARVRVDPFAYREQKDHKSLVGQIVRVHDYGVVNIDWLQTEHGGSNSCLRSYLEVLCEESPAALSSLGIKSAKGKAGK